MPPNLDVYAISPARNRDTIERFLDMYVDRAASEDRGDEELMILALDPSGEPSDVDDWDWEPAKTLTHIIERGLQHPRRAFSIYLKTQDPSLVRAILSFTTDDQAIFGVSLDDEGARPENLEQAKVLLHEMIHALGGLRGFIGVEAPPPLRGTLDGKNVWVYSWAASSTF